MNKQEYEKKWKELADKDPALAAAMQAVISSVKRSSIRSLIDGYSEAQPDVIKHVIDEIDGLTSLVEPDAAERLMEVRKKLLETARGKQAVKTYEIMAAADPKITTTAASTNTTIADSEEQGSG